MFNKIGIGGILSFDSKQAEASMARTNKAFGGLANSAGKLSRAGAAAGTAAMGMSAAMLPLVGAGAAAVSIYSDFTKQMSGVNAVAQLSEAQFAALREEAIRLGGSTQFTATEAAAGMEELARAGFSANEILDATSGVLALAAADGMGLADASRITANVLRGLGMDASEAGRAADVLALTSAKTNTDVMALGEAFKMAASTSALLGVDLEETSAILGVLADAGLRGTQGGTSFSNMMNKLTKPTAKAAAFLKQYNVQMTNADGSMRNIGAIVGDISKGLEQIPDVAQRTAMAMELTGLRGVKALNAIDLAVKSGKLGQLEEQLDNASGAAKRMADERLNNLAGQFTLLKSAAEGFTIRMLDQFKSLDGSGLKPIVETLSAINLAWDDMTKWFAAGAKDADVMEGLTEQYGETVAGIVMGIRDGMRDIKSVLKFITDKFKEWSGALEDSFGGETVRKITRIATVIAGLTTVAAPVVVALTGIAFVISTVVIPAVTALAGLVQAAFWPVLVVLGAVALAYFVLRDENESFGETVTRVWGNIKAAAMDFYQNVLLPLWEGIVAGYEYIWPMLSATALETFAAIREVVAEFKELWSSTMGGAEVDWKSFAYTVIVYAGAFVNFLLKNVIGVMKIFANMTREIRQAFIELGSGDVLTGIKRLANVLINTLLLPLRAIAGVIANLMETALSMPGVEDALTVGQVAKAKGMAEKMKGFSANGIQVFDVPEVTRADTGAAGGQLGTNDSMASIQGLAGMGEGGYTEASPEDLLAMDGYGYTDASAELAKAVGDGVAQGLQNTKLETNVESRVCIDGKDVARNQAKHQQDLADRLGFQTSPFVRRQRAEQGQLP